MLNSKKSSNFVASFSKGRITSYFFCVIDLVFYYMVSHQNNLLRFLTLDYANLSELIDKYMFISLVLDELTFRKYFEKEEDMSIAFLRKRLHKKMSYTLYNKRPIALLEIWLGEMQVMRLITLSRSEENKDIIISKLTERGEKAYQEQTYHQIYANLLAAKRSRLLSVIAICISIISIILTLYISKNTVVC